MTVLNESISGVHYSVTVTFTHEVIIQSVDGLKSQEICSINSTQFTKAAKTSCTNLNSNTSYTLTFQGLVNFIDAVIPLEFIVNFATDTIANGQVTGNMTAIVIH